MAEFYYVGSTSQTVDLFIQHSTTGNGLTGLAYNTASLTAYSRKGATGTSTAITLATQTVAGAWSSGGFVEIDSANKPGEYRFDIPDGLLDTAGITTITLRGAANMLSVRLRLDCRAVPGSVKEIVANAINAAALAANTGLKPLYTGSVTSGSATTYVMSGITAANDDLNGYRIRITSGAMIGQTKMIKDWISSSSTMEFDVAFSTDLSAADTFVIEPAQSNMKYVNDAAAVAAALETDIAECLDRLGFLLAREAGAATGPQTSTPSYTITRSGSTFTVDMDGVTSTGVRTAPTLTKT